MRIGKMIESKYKEFAKYTYTKEEVENLTKSNKYNLGNCDAFSVYHAYVGRHDQPGVYDKRPCVVLEDLGEKVKVFKLSSKNNRVKNIIFYEIKHYGNLNLKDTSYVRVEKDAYIINKKWITLYDGNLSAEDSSNIIEILESDQMKKKIKESNRRRKLAEEIWEIYYHSRPVMDCDDIGITMINPDEDW